MGKYKSLLANLELDSGIFHRLNKEAGFFVSFFLPKIYFGTFFMLNEGYKKWYPDARKVFGMVRDLLLFLWSKPPGTEMDLQNTPLL